MKLTRRSFLAAGAVATCYGAAPKRPNFVFILVNDLRFDALGCTGHPFSKTPNIDRLAREGVNFTNTFVTTPLCSPARGSFLTGQYVRTHGIRDNTRNNEASHKLVTFPKLLHDAGYETGYVGKWHMGNDDAPRPGFDRWVSFRGQGQYVDPQLNINGKPQKAEGYITDLLSSHAVDFVSRKREKPFCLYLAHKAVHGPFTPPERYKNLYEGQTVPRPVALNQLRCLAAIDDGVGQILQALTETGQLDNTLVVFTSDNGYFWGEHGLGDKRAAFEESIRIPMVARYPKLIKAGSKAPELALNIDIAPTLLDLGGAKIPASMQGQSLAPVLRASGAKWRRSFLIEYFEEKQYPHISTWQGVRSTRWKYVRYPGKDGMDELYDIQADPGEMKNRINEPSAQPALKEMKAELERLLKETER